MKYKIGITNFIDCLIDAHDIHDIKFKILVFQNENEKKYLPHPYGSRSPLLNPRRRINNIFYRKKLASPK